MDGRRDSRFGPAWAFGACLAVALTLPGPARALTLPVAARGSTAGLKDGPRVWALLNRNAPGPDDDADWPPPRPAVPGGGMGAEDRGGLPPNDPSPRPEGPNPGPRTPGPGLLPAGAAGGGARPSGGDAPTAAGLPADPPDLGSPAAGRLAAERAVLDLPEHATSIFRPPRP
jgi:hypothetical protein